MRIVSNSRRWQRVALTLLTAFALSEPLRAQTPAPATTPASPAPSCGPTNAGDPCGTSANAPASQPDTANAPNLGVGNPINLATGNKHQTEVDMPALPGVLGLELVRHYDSARSQPGAVNRLLGRGWRLSYESELFVIGSTVQVMQADGSRVIFSRDATNPSRCASTDPARGHIEARRTARGEAFIWHWPNGRRLHFDERGRLEQIVAPTGEFVSLRYDLQGLLIEVRDPQGRALHLNYARGPGFQGVAGIDTPVGRFDYAYGGEPPKGTDPALQAQAAARLIRVTAPADAGKRSARHYLYENSKQPTLLTGIAVGFEGVEPQRTVTWAYDERGRAILSLKGPASDPASERIVLRYPEPASPAVKKAVTEVITARGTTTYEHAIVGAEHRLIRATGPGCASCAQTDRAYGYDALGRLVSTSRLDTQGHTLDTVRSERDGLGRVVRIVRIERVERVEALPTGRQARLLAQRTQAQLIARYEYPADRELDGRRIASFEPSLIAEPSVIPGREHQWRIERNEAGQITRRTERGYSPLDQGKPGEARIERTTTYTYQRLNGRSLLASADGPLANGPKQDSSDSDVTRFEWDDNGNAITRVVQPGSLVNDLRYDAAGRVAEARNDAGHIGRFEHDALGHITRLTQGWIGAPDSGALLRARVQMRTYDALGRLVEGGHAATDEPTDYRGDWRLAYDASGRVEQMASASGTLWTQSFDAEGHLLNARQRSARFDRTWRYRYDAQGRLTETEDSALDVEGSQPTPSARYVYNESGKAAFDALNRPARASMRVKARRGERITTAVNGATTREQYDDFGRVVVLDSADSGRSIRAFDAADRLIGMRDALGHEARYSYDVQGRVAEQTVGAPASTTRWRYQSRQLVEVQDDAQTERYGYDGFGRRTSKTVTLNIGDRTTTATTSYGYDEAGQLQSQSLADGSLVVYERDGQGQVTALRRETITTPWLRWLAPSQRLASDIRRDAGGLAHYQAGNGMHTEWQRSRAGVLARLVHRRDKPLTPPQARTAFLDLLGVGAAHAQEQGQARDPLALIDRRYLWDRAGNLLLEQSQDGRTGYAYDRANRLIAVQRVTGDAMQAVAQRASAPTSLWRYHHDANGNRLLTQEGDNVKRIDYAKASNRSGAVDAAGQTTKLDGKQLEWDAIGRLASVTGQDFEAAYAYSHRGERTAKTVRRKEASIETGYLYDDAGRIAAELNASGRITRLYVHMADLPLAVIDGEVEATASSDGSWDRIANDLKRAWRARDQATVFLHLNHLNAPEAATDQDGLVIWTASYAPYGRATTTSTHFKLHLRLPGQYEDEETGLYDNRHRTYDPDQGRYLGADPLGLKAGANGFIYVNDNPLRYVDPDGLVLFAFDGTDNTNDPQWLQQHGSSFTNVWQFSQLYNDGNYRYVTGVGTVHRDAAYGDIAPPPLDDAFNFSGSQRIARMVQYFNDEADLVTNDDEVMEVDIVGFSRGAAQARDFANQIVENTRNGCYSYTDRDGVQHQQRVRFRFMGLFDTVLSTNINRSYNLAIPSEFASVAHAVALNEYRGDIVHPQWSLGAFPLESILPAESTDGHTRIERGFLGAHADIGGGFGADESQLAQVALAWMVRQAEMAGVNMNTPPSTIIANPVLHDRSDSIRTGEPAANAEDRQVRYADGTTARERGEWREGMSNFETGQFISYLPRNDPARQRFQTGTVDMAAYLEFLRRNGYDLGDLHVGQP